MKNKELKEKGNIIPKHYLEGGMHLLEIMQTKLPKEQVVGFLKGNILKYLFRYKQKNGYEDLEKARWYFDELMEVENENNK